MDDHQEYAFECWLDAWCVAWAHVGQAHSSRVSRSALGTYQLNWYQRGVMMGLLQSSLTRARLDALHNEESKR